MADMQADMGVQRGLSGGHMNASSQTDVYSAGQARLAQERAYEAMQAKAASGYMQAVPRKLSDVVAHNYDLACKLAEEAERIAIFLSGHENAANSAGSSTSDPTLVERAGHIGLVLSRIERSLTRISAAL